MVVQCSSDANRESDNKNTPSEKELHRPPIVLDFHQVGWLKVVTWPRFTSQISEQMSEPDLHVFTIKSLTPGFFTVLESKKIKSFLYN